MKTMDVSMGYRVGQNVVIEENVEIGQGTYLGHNVVVHSDTKVGSNVWIDDGSILGREPRSGPSSKRKAEQNLPPLEIGDECVIGVNAILYRGTKIGSQVLVGDLASIRERNIIGDGSIIGRLVMVEPKTKIGNHVVIQTGSHITGDMIIEDEVFVGDEVSTANDNMIGKGGRVYIGPYIKKGARIGSNATLLPGVVIGQDAVVGAGSVVTKDVPPQAKVMGTRARVVSGDGFKVCASCGEKALFYREEHHNYKCAACGHVDFRGYNEE